MNDTITTNPSSLAAEQVTLGDQCRASGDLGAAIRHYNQALRHTPYSADIYRALAETLEKGKHYDTAIKAWEQWLKVLRVGRSAPAAVAKDKIEKIEYLFAQARAAHQQGKPDQVIEGCNAILRLHADTPNAMVLLATALSSVGKLSEAEHYFIRAMHLRDDPSEPLHALYQHYFVHKNYPQAIAAAKQYLAHTAKASASVWIIIGKSYFLLDRQGDAIAAYERAAADNPNHIDLLAELLRLESYFCQWQAMQPLLARIQALIAGGKCADPTTLVSFPGAHTLANVQRWGQKHYPQAKPYNAEVFLPAETRGDGKLRIGYLSSDYYNHATSALICEMFELHDRAKFHITAYSHGEDDGSAERKRIMQSVDQFRDVASLSDAQAASQMTADGIDILVDLKGYTIRHRMGIVALRPAPIQIHYLGYPASTGLCAIDYFIADAKCLPPETEAQFSEQIIRLPHSYQINDRKRIFPEGSLPRSAYGLPNEGLVFAVFNNPYKITADMFAVWMRLLKRVAGSVLWVYESDPAVTPVLKAAAVSHGVAAERIVMAKSISTNQHLMRYWHADIALDTAPVTGHTTTSDALWCGIPVITLKGEYFTSRVAASLLENVGLSECVAPTLDAYEEMAFALAMDREMRHRIRRHLTEGRMTFPLFDSAATTRAIEAAYLKAAELHRQGKKPQHFSV